MNKKKGFFWLLLALLAFGGLGLEAVLAFALEPLLYGAQLGQWNTGQNIAHWVATCIIWLAVSRLLVAMAKKKQGLDLLAAGERVRPWQWLVIGVLVVFSLWVSYIDWNGSKVLLELRYNGWLKFIFQYIYYIVETLLVTLILVFGQLALEEFTGRRNIPWGGILIALTWGVGHFFTKDFATGIICMVSGLSFGSVYLLAGRDLRKTYPIMLAMFVL